MKFSIYSWILTIAGYNYVVGSYLEGDSLLSFNIGINDEIDIGESCKNDLQNNLECIQNLEIDIIKHENDIESSGITDICNPKNNNGNLDNCKALISEFIKASCQNFEADYCKSFIEDNTVKNLIINSNCYETSDGIDLLLDIAKLKSFYLLICRSNSNNEKCPITQYLTDGGIDYMFKNYEQFQTLKEKIEEYEGIDEIKNRLPNTLLTAIADNCRDKSCNKNVIAINDMVTTANNVFEKKYEKTFNELYPNALGFYNSIINSYKEQQCSIIDGGKNGAYTNKKITFTFLAMITITILLLI